MTRRISSLRQHPKQARAKKTLERIKKTTLKLLIEDGGDDAVTTVVIAEAANLNIATLYHYFPNLRAIVEEIYSDLVTEFVESSNKMFLEKVGKDMNEAIFEFLLWMTEFALQKKQIVLCISSQIPGMQSSEEQAMLMGGISYTAANLFLMQKYPHLTKEQIDVKYYFGGRAALAMIQHYIFNPHPRISSREFAMELSRMIVVYMDLPAVLPGSTQ